MLLISNLETIALNKAIELKKAKIDILFKKFDAIPQNEWHLYNFPNKEKLDLHQKSLNRKNNLVSIPFKNKI